MDELPYAKKVGDLCVYNEYFRSFPSETPNQGIYGPNKNAELLNVRFTKPLELNALPVRNERMSLHVFKAWQVNINSVVQSIVRLSQTNHRQRSRSENELFVLCCADG